MTALEVLGQQVINGFTTGSYLALIALGYTMVYGLIELINFAHGDIYALGFFFSLTLFTWSTSAWTVWPTSRCGGRHVSRR
jgi:branched-chain amino acid transport system permease protein